MQSDRNMGKSRYLFLLMGAMYLFALSCQTSFAASPSFDCKKARSIVEKLICANEELAALDRNVASRYSEAIRSGSKSEKALERKIQRQWVRSRNRCGRSSNPVKCLRAIHYQRMEELSSQSKPAEWNDTCDYQNTQRDIFLEGKCKIIELNNQQHYGFVASLKGRAITIIFVNHQGQYHRWVINGKPAAAYEFNRTAYCGWSDDLTESFCFGEQ